MTSRSRVPPALTILHARYPDLETRYFLRRVRRILLQADPDGNQEIGAAIGERVSVRPDAFRIAPGPHEDWAPHVALVYAYLITPDGLPLQDEVAAYVQLWWELDSSETHELVLVLVDLDGHETPMAMADLAIGLDVVRHGPHSTPEEA